MTVAKLRNALNRLDAYEAPPADTPVMLDDNGCLYELLDGEEGEQLTLADLYAIIEDVDNHG